MLWKQKQKSKFDGVTIYEVFIFAWTRAKSRQLEQSNKRNESIEKQLQFEFIRAVLALNYAIDHPDKVKALVLIAAQYKMPRKLLKVQNMLFHLMPNSAFNKMGFKKADVISLCGTMAELDFSDSLYKVSCPVLIVCGEKDKANKKTSKELCHYLNNSDFYELMKTGHEANIEAPEELAIVLQRFYDSINQLPVYLEVTESEKLKYVKEKHYGNIWKKQKRTRKRIYE